MDELFHAIEREKKEALRASTTDGRTAGGTRSRYVAQDRTNRQIVEQLVVTETTVWSHAGHILRKLPLASRSRAILHAL